MAVAFVKNHTVTSNKTSGTTLDLTLDTSVPAGNLIVARLVYDNAGTASKPLVTGIARAAGETNTWATAVGSNSTSTSAGAFASGAMTWIVTTVAWPAANYTATLDTATVQKAGGFQEFSGATATARSTAGTAYSTTTTAASAATTGTAPVIGDLALGFIFGSNVAVAQAGDTDTTAGSWSAVAGVGSTGGSGATNNFGVAQYKILTGASAQTLNNSAAMTAGNGVIVTILQAYVPPSITQAAYRFYADGTETGSTALASQDTAPTVDTSGGDVNAGLRVRLQNTTAIAGLATDDWQLQWLHGDWYDESNHGGYVGLSTSTSQTAQSFIGPGGPLTTVTFYMRKGDNPTGTVNAALWTHTGTFGSGALPTGSPLTISTNSITASALPSDPRTPTTFTFDGSVTLTAGTPYFVGLYATGASSAVVGSAEVSRDNATPTHPGQQANFTTGWAAIVGGDLVFELGLWTNVASAGTVNAYNSANLTDGAATTNRLGAGSGSFVAGKVSEDGLVDDFGMTASNYTELLYSITVKQADVAPTDTLRFRVLRNGATTGLTYTQVPTVTIGAGGPTDRTGTATGTITLAGTSSGTKDVTATATGR